MKKLFLLSITLLFGVSLGFAQSNTRFQKSSARVTKNVTTSNMNTVNQKAVRGTRSNDPSIAGDCVVDKNGNTICILNTTQPGAKATNSTETKAVRGTRPNDPKVAGWDYVDKDGNTWKMVDRPTQQGGIKSPIKGKTPVRTAPARGSRNVRR